MYAMISSFIRQRGRAIGLAALIGALAVLAASPGAAGAQSDPLAVDTPADLQATPRVNAVSLRWTPPAGAQYHLAACLPNYSVSDASARFQPVGAAGSAAISGLEAGTQYQCAVIAGRWSGLGDDYGAQWSSWSNWATATPIAGGVAADRAALAALYNSADGANWGNNDNWLSDAPLGDWYGVETDDSGRIARLYLKDGLNGTIPPELGNLANLNHLDLHSNQLNGTIPPELGNLANLHGLDLGRNQLSGAIPAELGSLTNLTKLDLGGNRLNGTIPPALGNLVNLYELSLSGNRLTGCVPAAWRDVAQRAVGRNDLRELGLPFCE